jgi:branched-chain amino acid transport system ATP-binding protein
VFQDLSVTDNLLLGGANDPDESRRKERQQLVYELFPILKEREEQLAGTMSGGQQRMVSLGIALMSNPKLLILDEPSLGLAPSVVEQIFGVVRDLVASEGLSVILLEQNVGQALKIADRGYVMRSGRIVIEETIEQMKARDSFWDFF